MDYTYQNAQRLGERCYKEKMARGEDPFLPVLDHITAGSGPLSEQALGLEEIPLDQIAGTVSDGRRQAFAADFMPLMSERSEFAAKYRALIEAQQTEGIRDPVKVYEYLHRYYVAEGNKRVSVLKLFNAFSVPAEVTRIIPARSDDPAVRVYYEFLAFYQIVPVSYLAFSGSGDYERFLKLTGWSAENPPNAKDLRDLRSAYFRFQAAYRAVGPDKETALADSDAFLVYLQIFGWENARDIMPDELRKALLQIREEFTLRPGSESIKLITDVGEVKKQSLLQKIFIPEKVLKIAFLYEKTPETLSWTYGHELGRRHVEEVFGEKIDSGVYENVDGGNIEDTILTAVQDGADVIFVTSSRFLNVCLKAAVTYQNVRILCCALYYPHRYLRTYYARIYEAKFISGVLAGIMSGGGDIGYVANCPFLANILNLNAFAGGVKMTAPQAKVHVVWTDEIGADPRVTFWEEGISLISGRELLAPVEDYHREFGLYRYTETHELKHLAMTLWNWGIIYQRLIESIRSGSWDEIEKKNAGQALNYFWGMDSGAIELLQEENLPEGAAQLARQLTADVRSGILSPFYWISPVPEAKTEPSVQAGRILRALRERGWLLDNIVGHIPAVEELRPEVRLLAETQGIKSLDDGFLNE